MRETARRLILRGVTSRRRREAAKQLPYQVQLDASNIEQVTAWSLMATYLCGRIQSTPQQRPGREPDMSEASAQQMQAVLQEIWWEAWVILRHRKKAR